VGNLTGLGFTASMINENLGIGYTAFALIPFITMFMAIGFNCLRNRYWGIIVVVLIFLALYFFFNVAAMFKGFSLEHDPSVVAGSEAGEGMPVAGMGIGFYTSFILTILAMISALISLMPFKFNKRLEESFDKRFVDSKKHISKMGHDIHDEFHKIGKHTAQQSEAIKKTENVESATKIPEQPTATDSSDESRFMPKQEGTSDEDKYSDYMPKQ